MTGASALAPTPLRARGSALGEHLRTIGIAARLGFAMESNWAPLWAYLAYMLVRPIATSGIIVIMYLVAGTTNPAKLTYMFIGNALFTFVGNILFGINQTVIEDREHYQMLKYIYTAPVSIYAFLLGRGLVKLCFAAFSVVVTIAFGARFLPIEFHLAAVDWPLFAVASLLGWSTLVFLGILLAGVTLNTARHSFFLSEAIAGVLYLVSGAVFEPAVLPAGLRAVTYAVPLTYWVELARRALVGPASYPTGLEGISNAAMLAILAAATVASGVASIAGYRVLERRARRMGRLDQKTDY